MTRVAIAAAATSLLAGCASVNPRPAFEDVQKTVADRSKVQPEWSRTASEGSATEQAVAKLLTAPLTVDAAVQVAFLNNPTLQATFEEIGISQADLAQAARIANPEISGFVRRTTVPAGTILISAQVPGEAVYFVVEGSVKVQLVRESGVELTLALLGPGDIVGEMSLVTGRGRSAHVITRESTTLLWMDRRAFLKALELAPGLSRNLITELSSRLQVANERFQALAEAKVIA